MPTDLPPSPSVPSPQAAGGRPRHRPGGSDGLNLVVVWRTVRKNWAIALVVTLALSMFVTFRTLGELKIYEAQATIIFDPNPPRPLGAKVETVVDMGAGNVWDTREYYETQFQIIQSSHIAVLVVQELGLHRDPAFLRNLPAGKEPLGAPEPVSEDVAAEVLRGRYRVEAVKNSRIARIRLEDANPERAARILNTLIDVYVAQNLEDALSSTSNAGDWLRAQLDKLKSELEQSEDALHDYKKERNILSVSFDDQSNMLRGEMNQLNEALTAVRAKQEEIAARRNVLSKVSSDDPTNLPSTELLQSGSLSAARQAYQRARAERDALRGLNKGPNHPEMQAAEATVAATREAVLSEVRSIKGALDRDLQMIGQQEGGLSRLFERAKTQALELNALEIEFKRLRRTKENNEKLFGLVQEREKESSLARMMRVNNIRVLDRPRIPKSPVRPNVPMNVGAGVAIGLLLGIAAAMARALLDRTLKTPDDIEQRLNVTFLGLIPEIDKVERKARGKRRHTQTEGQPELVVHDNPMGGIAEAARVVRTNLTFMAPDNPFRRLLVTSAGPAEGKTTFACCIAIAMAQAGKRVVLVDCDLRRPRLHRVFKTGSDEGLTTALFDESSPEAVAHETKVDNLWVIPAGPTPPNPAELLHSDRFKRFLKELEGRFDRVILDSPPVAVVTDSAVLATQVDGTVLVVRAFKTHKDLATHAVRALQDVGANIAGVVLNAVNLDRAEYKYGYHYYRRDSYYYGERKSDAPPGKPGRGKGRRGRQEEPSSPAV